MFNILYRCARTIARHQNGPLAESRCHYLERRLSENHCDVTHDPHAASYAFVTQHLKKGKLLPPG